MIYRCSKDFIQEDGILKVLDLNDVVIIAGIEHKVWSFTLFRVYAKDPEKVFKLLLIFNKEKYCKTYYHYNNYTHKYYGFPHFHDHDYEAITRVVIALMNRWERWEWWLLLVKKSKRWLG